MFSWVPSQVWIALGLVLAFVFLVEIIKVILYNDERAKYIFPFFLFVISGIALSILEGQNIFIIIKQEYGNSLSYVSYIFNISFVSAIFLSQYFYYDDIKKSGDKDKIVKFKKTLKEFIVPLMILVIIRVLVMFL